MDGLTEAIDAARALLPAWTGVAGLLLFVPGGFALGALVSLVGGAVALGPVRRARNAEWTERARTAQPLAMLLGFMSLAPAMLMGWIAALHCGPLEWVPARGVGSLTFAATYLGGFTVRWPMRQAIRPVGTGPLRGLRDELLQLLLIGPHVLLMILMLSTVEREPGRLGLAWIGVAILGLTLIAWHGGLPLLRLLGWTRPAGPRLSRIVEEVGSQIGIRPRRVWTAPWRCANAAAFPLSQQLLFSDRICEILDDEELAAIAAHEFGHLSEPWSVRLARMLMVLALLPVGLVAPLTHWGGIYTGLAACGVYWIVMVLAVRWVRRLEHRADGVAHAHSEDPARYARALEKLYRENLAPVSTGSKNRTHPDLYDRMLAAGVSPEYPRPAPPSRWRLLGATGVAAGVFAALAMGLTHVPELLAMGDEAALLRVAGSGGRRGLLDLASSRARSGAEAEAIVFARLAANVDPRDHHAPAFLSWLLGGGGDCEAASEALDLAESRTRSAEQMEQCGWIARARRQLPLCETVPASLDVMPLPE